MAFTADAIINNVTSRLGDTGRHVWDYYKLATGTPWCVGEVCYTFNKTGNRAQIFSGRAIFYVPTAQEWCAKHFKTIYDYRSGGDLRNVRKGDVIFFMWKRGSRDHIGIARATGEADELHTIEGNTSGGRVANRTRAKKYIFAVYRPPYKETSAKPTKTAQKQKQAATLPSYKKGKTYTVKVDCLSVRTGAGTNYTKKKKSQLTKDGQRHANANGELMTGTRVTVSDSRVEGGNVWIRIPSGWICAYYKGKYYVR